jgi:hypothetical protein
VRVALAALQRHAIQRTLAVDRVGAFVAELARNALMLVALERAAELILVEAEACARISTGTV